MARERLPEAEGVLTPAQMIAKQDTDKDGFRQVPLLESEGYLSAEYAYLYPPGIPMVVPGEKITAQTVEHFRWYMDRAYEIQGTKREGYIEVWTRG